MLHAAAFICASCTVGVLLAQRACKGYLARIQQLERECGTDFLTGVLNRKGGREKMGTMLELCKRHGKYLGVCIADIDHFKDYNDAYGHLEGDRALRLVAGALKQTFARSSDMVCRFGGEEFLVCFSCRDLAEGRARVEALLAGVASLGICTPDTCAGACLTVSVGATFYEPGHDPVTALMNDLIGRADRALYIAKKNGRNCAEIMKNEA